MKLQALLLASATLALAACGEPTLKEACFKYGDHENMSDGRITRISTGEDLVTLKARSSLGILPEIKADKVPEAFQAKLKESLATFADEVHRASPESVIDRAREAASQALLAYYDLRRNEAKDLGELVTRLENEKKVIASNTARIIARLHARAKSSEQEKYQLRPIREQDAELAIECLGTLLCELDIAEWA